jgi:hypothetical protein
MTSPLRRESSLGRGFSGRGFSQSTGEFDAHWHLSAATINVLAGQDGMFRADCPEIPGSMRYWSGVTEYLWSAPTTADACKTSYEQTDSSFATSWLCTGCWGLTCEGNMVTSHYIYPGIASPWYCGASHTVDFELWVK